MSNGLDISLLSSYEKSLSRDGVSGERMAKRFKALSEIGKLSSGGVTRYAYSPEEQAAFDLARTWLEEAGAEIEIDGAGNLIGHIKGQFSDKTYAAGSHLDTVPHGGNFDGTVGVLTAIEIAQAWADQGITPKYDYEVMIFREEEGSQFNVGVLGSSAFMGLQSEDAVQDLKATTTDLPFKETMEDNGLTVNSFLNAYKERNYALYLEPHIEQGKFLDDADFPVGVVSGIAGLRNLTFVFKGLSKHAGNTAMADRLDPVVAAGKFIYDISLLPEKVSETAVATVGKINVVPNGANVIADHVELTVDIRDITSENIQALEYLIIDTAFNIAEKRNIIVDYVKTTNVEPVPIADDLQNELMTTIEETVGEKSLVLSSGAGHDAMNLAKEYPIAMIFIKSKNGESHSPKEWSELTDIVWGVHVSKKFIEKKMNH